MLRWLGTALALALWVLPAQAQRLTVAADTSLREALPAVARSFEAAHPGVTLVLQWGAPGTLLSQMGSGSAIDLLVGADAETVAAGVRRQLLLPDVRSLFATNTLVLAVPTSLNLPVQQLVDLGRPEVTRIAMAREAVDAAGRYAREAINAQRLWPLVQRKVVATEDVRAALALVANADVEAGFVYASDAATSARVRVVQTLPSATPIRYLAHVAAASPQPALARDFIVHLRSDAARAEWARRGLGLP
jgi:molybdate transport system substrate-binding protein